MKTILVTGASGFIGRNICGQLSNSHYEVVACDKVVPKKSATNNSRIVSMDINIPDQINSICKRYHPDIIIHCAGIAHQKIGSGLKKSDYENINHKATIKLAKIASASNPNLYFIYLSSISVYGELNGSKVVDEKTQCYPTTAYAQSKLNAENSLIKIFNSRKLKNLDILRLAPVYDVQWGLNLEKRVFGPRKICYVRYGRGKQRMSALARGNLIDFIESRIELHGKGSFNVFNVTDRHSYTFDQIINIFKKSRYQPNRISIYVPLKSIWIGTRFLSIFFPKKAKWICACYDKLSLDLVFDNKKMLETGFKPKYDLAKVYSRR